MSNNLIKITQQPVKYESHSDYITKILRNNIISFTLKPGQFISENDVRKEFHVSRTPVREAFITLSTEQLVEIRPQQGTYVSYLDKSWIKNFLFMRSAIEKKVMEEAAQVISTSYLDKLQDNLEQQYKKENQIPEQFIELDNCFHLLIYESVAKNDIWNVINSAQSAYDRLRFLFFQEEQTYSLTIKQHEKIFEFLQNRQVANITKISEEHVGSQFLLFSKQIENNKQYFI